MTGPMSSQGTKVWLGTGSPTSAPLSSVSKAKPAIATMGSTAHGLVAGDYVMPVDTGWPSLDEKVFVALGVTGTTVTLGGSDTTSENLSTIAAGADIMQDDMVEVCMASVNRESPASSVLDVTTLCDGSRKQLTGLKNNGTWTGQGFYEPGSAGQAELREAYDEGDQRPMALEAPDGSKIMYTTQVNQLSEAFAVDQPVQVNMGGVINGAVVYYVPPAT